jgi:hypothetical protein
MRKAPHVITSDDLIAIGVQGEPVACVGDQGGRCCGIMGRSARSYAPLMLAVVLSFHRPVGNPKRKV